MTHFIPGKGSRRTKIIRHLKMVPASCVHLWVALLSLMIGLTPVQVAALPSGGTVQDGVAEIQDAGPGSLNINQQSQRAIIDWIHFNIQTDEQVNFNMPSPESVNLSRVTGGQVSEIFGQLTSNGQLFLVNPNGILFGQGSQVDVSGLVATTSDISNADFMAGHYNFNIASPAQSRVINRGNITVRQGGLAAFVAPGVENSGVINAHLGRVSLASGKTFTLDLYGDELVSLGLDSQVTEQVLGPDGEALTSLVDNSGQIFADGGRVTMSVNTARDVVDHAINMSGLVQARSVMEKNGEIYLTSGETGTVNVTGTLDASGYGDGETGGIIHVLGDRVFLDDYGFIDISGHAGGGSLLFGGDYQGNGTVQNATDTYVGPDTRIWADAVNTGNGGRAIFWADRRNYFLGRVRSRGGLTSGNGGFVEVSGKETLFFNGYVDTTAQSGETGTLLLDPGDIIISQSTGEPDDVELPDISASGAVSFTISELALETQASTTNINLFAEDNITVNNLTDNLLNLQQTAGRRVTLTAKNGNIFFQDANDELRTQGGDITLKAGGDMTLGKLNAGAGTVSIFGNDEGSISLGTDTSGDIKLDNGELAGITAGNLVIGGSNASDGRARTIAVNGVITGPTITGTTTLRALAPEKAQFGLTLPAGSVGFGGSVSSFSNTALTVEALDGVNIGSSLTAGGNLTLEGDLNNIPDLSASGTPDGVNLAAGVVLNSLNGNLTLRGTTNGIVGAGAVTLNAANGTIILDDNISAAGDLTFGGSVTLQGAATTLNVGTNKIFFGGNSLNALNGINLNSDADFTGTGPFTINTDTNSLGGVFTIASGKTLNTLGKDVSITASDLILNGNLNSGVGSTAFNASTAGGVDLALANTGKLFRLDNLELVRITAGSLAIGAVSGTLVANGVDRTTHLANIAGGVTLGGGSVQFLGAGSTFNSLTVNGPATIAGVNVTTNNGALLFNNGLSLTTGTVQLSTGAGGGDLSLLGTVDGAQMLTLNSGTGSVVLGGNIGNGNALTSLDVTGNTTISGSSITTSNGNVTFNNNVTLGNTVSVNTGAGGGDATFGGTVDATTAGVQGLTVSTGTGTSTFQGNVGTGTALGSLTVNGDSTINGDVTAQNGNVSFNNNLTLGANSTIASGGGNINFSAVNGAQTLALNSGAGTVNLDGNIGSGTALTSLDVTGNATLSGITLTTSNGNVTFNDNITLDTGATSVNTGAGGGDISFNAIDGTQDLALNAGTGAVNLNGSVGATNRLASLSSAGTTTTISGSSLSTNSGITFTGDVTTSTGSVSLNADADNTGAGDFTQVSGNLATTGNQNISITAKDINVSGTINSGTGTTTLIASQNQAISLGDPAAGFNLSNTDLGNITAGGLVIGNSTGNITANNVTSTLNTTLNGSTVTFNGAASSFGSLVVNGTTTVDGVNVSTNNAPLTFSNNVMLMNGPILLSTGAGGGDLSLLGNVDGGVDLTLTSGTGNVIFGGAVGSSTRLNSLTVNGATTFNGPSLFTNNGITFNGAVSATNAGGFSLNADGDNNGSGTFNQLSGTLSTGGNNLSITADDISLAGTINAGAGTVTIISTMGKTISLGDATGGLRLSNTDLGNITSGGFVFGNSTGAITVNNVNLVSTVLNGTAVTFNGAASAFQGLTVNGATTIDGVDLSTPGAQNIVFNSMLTLTTGAVQVTTVGGNLTFASTINGAQALTVNPGAGTTTFGNSIGNTTALASLNLSGTTVMNGSSISVNDGLTNNGNFTRNGTLSVNTDANADGNGTFNHDGGTFTTTNGNLNLTVDDVVLGGTGLVNTGTGTLSVQTVDNGTIGLGAANCGGACGTTLSGAELQNITTARLSAGKTTGSAVFVDGVTSANSDGLGQVDILSGGTATFDNQSTFKNLNVAADDIAVNDVLSAATGTLTVRTSAGGTLGVGSSAGDMTLDSDELGRLRAGTLNLGDSATGNLMLGGLTLDASNITQAFNASTGGALTVQGSLVSPVNTSLSSSGAGQGIMLNHAGNFFGGNLSLNTASGGSVSISNLSNGGQALRLGNSSIGGGFSVSSSTAIRFIGGVSANGAVNVTNTSSGGILFDDGAFLNSGGGTLRLETPGSLTLGQLISTSSASNAVQLQIGGAVIDGGDMGGEDIIAATGGLVVRTGNGFGTEADAIEIRVASLDMINSAGDISFFETDDLEIVQLVQEGGGNIFGSYDGTLTGEDNIEIMQGKFFITNRLNGVTLSQELGTTGKDRDALAVERTINNLIDFEFAGGFNRFDWQIVEASPAGLIRRAGPAGGLFFHRLFDERFALVDVKEGNPRDGDLAHLENVWHWSRPVEQVKKKPKAEKEKKTAQEKIEKKPVAKKARATKPRPSKKKKDEGFLSFFKKAGKVFSFK